MSKKKRTASAVNQPKAMTVKEFAEWLLATYDHDLPVHRRDGGGDFPPLDAGKAMTIVEGRELMRMKNNDHGYTADVRDTVWAKRRDDFETPFKAVVVWSLSA
jgi:hypothetical protein|nr:hypothetical protein [Neorhizobium tomejilense]